MASTNTSWNKLGFSNSVGIALNPGPSNLFPNSVLMELHMLIINTKVLDRRKKPEPDLSFQKSKSTQP